MLMDFISLFCLSHSSEKSFEKWKNAWVKNDQQNKSFYIFRSIETENDYKYKYEKLKVFWNKI